MKLAIVLMWLAFFIFVHFHPSGISLGDLFMSAIGFILASLACKR